MDNGGTKSSQMIGQNEGSVDFVAAITHEFKTSLTAIIASAELLADELQPDKKSTTGRLIQSIIRNAHVIDERLSRFSEIGALLVKDLRFRPEPHEIGRVIHDVTTRLYPETQTKRQSVIVEVPDSLPLVKADSQYLEQILLTLIANASKFTPEGGQIKVSAWQDDNSLVVKVSDTGIGIPAEEQERIFQPYYQVKRDRGTRHRDSGLGLAITKFLVELHKGKIWVESIVGRGSDFFFSLPRVETE